MQMSLSSQGSAKSALVLQDEVMSLRKRQHKVTRVKCSGIRRLQDSLKRKKLFSWCRVYLGEGGTRLAVVKYGGIWGVSN